MKRRTTISKISRHPPSENGDLMRTPRMTNASSPQELTQQSSSSSADKTVAVPRASIDWYRSIPWWRLLSQAICISWRASHLVLAALAIACTSLGWVIGEKVFAPENVSSLWLTSNWAIAFPSQILTLPERLQRFTDSFPALEMTAESMTLRRSAYWVFGTLWTIGVWSFAGGLLARRSLMEMGVRTSVGWGPSCNLVCRRWLSMVWGIAMPLIATVGLALMPLMLGFVARAGFAGQLLSLLLMIPASLLAIGIGWCAAISAFGFPLSICAVVAEKNADAFDGVSRSAAYVFQRPMTLLVILILGLGLAWLGDFIVQTVLSCGEQFVWAAFSVGFGGNIQDRLGSDQGLLGGLFWGAHSIIPALRMAFLFSFFWSAAAAAYLTLRWEIDHTDFDELDLQEIGEPVALPQFTKDARDVAEAAELEQPSS
jgi:hypothetical protein